MLRHLATPLLVLVLVAVSACGGSSSDAPATESPQQAQAESGAAPDTESMSEPTCTDRAAQAAAAGATAAERGQLFLEANARCEGVTQTESGLQYAVLVQGEGDRPTAESVVEVHYEGTLLDGTVFDSSYRRNETIEFPLNRVIPGWTEGVGLMPVGSTYRLFIPSALAYGSRGAGGVIGPDETLIFKVELIAIAQ